MTRGPRGIIDVCLGAVAIIVCATVLALVSNHFARRPIVLLPPPKGETTVSPRRGTVPPLGAPRPRASSSLSTGVAVP